jgi:nucleotide-binding universal stress UspA family protein
MSKVLVPIDGSDASLRALRHATATADEVHIVNVQPKANHPGLRIHMTPEDIEKAQLEHGRETLASACRLLDESGRRYRTHVLIGEAAPKIVRVAKAQRVGSIVMGTRGLGAVRGLWLGSTATKVVHLADVPVTLVK